MWLLAAVQTDQSDKRWEESVTQRELGMPSSCNSTRNDFCQAHLPIFQSSVSMTLKHTRGSAVVMEIEYKMISLYIMHHISK